MNTVGKKWCANIAKSMIWLVSPSAGALGEFKRTSIAHTFGALFNINAPRGYKSAHFYIFMRFRVVGITVAIPR
jgi:hypothetical protein